MAPALLIAVAQAVLFWTVPWAAAALLCANLAAALTAFAMSLRSNADSHSESRSTTPRGGVPFVSVHVPTPRDADSAAAALTALSHIAYPAFEILVADPGGALSADPALAPFRGRALFLKLPAESNVADALNALIEEMDWRARYVAVVDPDFAVAPQFLRLALDHLERDPALAFVQFPKSLESAGPMGAAADLESRDALASVRPARGAALRMGAIAVVSVDALHAVGGWRAGASAAAAELGGRLWTAELTGAFIDAPVASALQKPDFAAIRRARATTVQAAAGLVWSQVRPFLRQRRNALALAAQVAAAPSFWLLPAASLAAWAIAVWTGLPASLGARAAEAIAAWTILATSALAAFRLVWIGVARRRGLRGIAAALTIRLALVWTASVAWLESRRERPPARKGLLARVTELNLAPAAIGLAAFMTAAWLGRPITLIAALILLATCPAAAWAVGALSARAWTKPA